jgi:peptidoglycan/xylan/chitin deacetylase (PgdA/CDA1 family)
VKDHSVLAKRVFSLAISLVFYCFVEVRRRIARLLGKDIRPECIVLYYHSVPAQDRRAFAKQLDLLTRTTVPVDIRNLPALVKGKRYSAITFDDGFEDAIKTVPELAKRSLPACFFVTAGFLGQKASWWPDSSPEQGGYIASLEQLRQLPSELISIGAHTMTHPRLTELNEADAREELTECRRRLQEMTGHEVQLMSFPYGDFNENLISWCREAGYSRVFTSEHKQAFQNPAEFAVGRVKAEPDDWSLEYRLKLVGAYCWMPAASAFKRKLREFSTALGFRPARSLVKKSVISG